MLMSCLVSMEVLCQVLMHALKAFACGLRDSPISAWMLSRSDGTTFLGAFLGHFWGIFEAGLTLPANGIVKITRITFPIFPWLIFLRGVSGKGKEAPVVQRRPALAFKGTPCFGMIRHRSCEYMGKQNGNQSGLVHWPL